MLNQTFTDVKTPQVIQFSDDTFVQIDREHGVAMLCRGQRTGVDSDWGGACIGSIELDKLMVIANAVYVPFSQSDDDYAAVWPIEYRADHVGM